jgi:hypothetical protein
MHQNSRRGKLMLRKMLFCSVPSIIPQRFCILKILFGCIQEGNANVSHTDKKGRSAVDEADRYHMNDAAVWLWLAGASTKNLKKAESTSYAL